MIRHIEPLPAPVLLRAFEESTERKLREALVAALQPVFDGVVDDAVGKAAEELQATIETHYHDLKNHLVVNLHMTRTTAEDKS
jgi:hypothetical protein